MNDPIILKKIEEEGVRKAHEDVQSALRDDPLLITRSLLTENDTLRKLAERSHKAFLYSSLISCVAVCAAVIAFSRDVEYRYFFINSKGHVYETSALQYPTATPETVINTASEIATKLHTWTYQNYVKNFNDLKMYCSDAAISPYVNKMLDDGIFEAAKRLVQHYDAVPSGGKIIGQRNLDSTGRLAWRVEIDINEDITGSMNPVSHAYNVIIDIEQVPLSVSPTGLQCTRIDENIRVKR
jgi:hypothetical protein